MPDGGDRAARSSVVESHDGHAILPVWHGMKYYTFTGRSMNSLLRLQGSTSSLYFDFDRYRAWQGEVSRQLPWDCLDRNLVFWCDTTHTGPHDVEECDALRDCVSMVGLCTSALIAESTSSTNERVRSIRDCISIIGVFTVVRV